MSGGSGNPTGPSHIRKTLWMDNTLTPTQDLSDVEARLAMPIAEAMLTQRAIRRVKPDPVDDRIVLRCLELALEAPTGSNRQNWEFVVVKDRAVKAKLGAQYRRLWKLYGGLGRRIRSGEQSVKILNSVQWQVEHFEEIPVLVVCCLRGGFRVPFLPNHRLRPRATTDRYTPAPRTSCSRRGLSASAVRSSRCPCGRIPWLVESSGCRQVSSRAASWPLAGQRVATGARLVSLSGLWFTSTSTANSHGVTKGQRLSDTTALTCPALASSTNALRLQTGGRPPFGAASIAVPLSIPPTKARRWPGALAVGA